ncbi:MAG: ATPase [Lachnospiraceae bacterium]|nr:ATPase [Lachnospiraceae bacterium]
MASKIEQTIEDIFDYLEGCKFAAFSNKESIIVNKDDIYDLLEELKNNIPDEIKHSRQIVQNRDAILDSAKSTAEALLAKAEEKQGELVEKNEIMQQAYAQAQEVVNQANANAIELLNQATTEANSYQMSAMKYTDDSLAGISDILTKAISDAQGRYQDLISSLSSCLQVVNSDRAQLQMANGPEQAIIPGASAGQVHVQNRGPQAKNAQGPGKAQPMPGQGKAAQDAPKAPLVDRSASIREEINDDDIDSI